MTDFPHGFNPVERNQALLKPMHGGVAPPIALSEIVSTIPDTPLIRKAIAHLRPILPLPIWNHSHRAYLHGEPHPKLGSSLRLKGRWDSGCDQDGQLSRVVLEPRVFLPHLPLPRSRRRTSLYSLDEDELRVSRRASPLPSASIQYDSLFVNV